MSGVEWTGGQEGRATNTSTKGMFTRTLRKHSDGRAKISLRSWMSEIGSDSPFLPSFFLLARLVLFRLPFLPFLPSSSFSLT